MATWRWFRCLGVSALLWVGVALGVYAFSGPADAAAPISQSSYIVLAWNDLGMHCYNRDFSDLAVLPPYNNLHAQVVRVADRPQVVTTGITVTYLFTDNTTSASKSNFWDFEEKLFGVKLQTDIGLKGKSLAGSMDLSGNQFVAEGIPLTEFTDSDPTHPQPFQLATVIVKDIATGHELARAVTVAPVSTEMHCDKCHANGEDASTGKVETNILTKHDEEEGTNLMTQRPVLCASCHSSNALGAPGKSGVASLSNAMHRRHSSEEAKSPDTLDGCYNCHPGPQTRCLRDVMSVKKGMTCIDCHGGMQKVGSNPQPWLNEPRCDSANCHADQVKQDQALYRMSTGMGRVACEGCHDSTHAIAPSSQPRDGLKFIAWQGKPGPLSQCTVCHATQPSRTRVHGRG
jgi:hypothetical protein